MRFKVPVKVARGYHRSVRTIAKNSDKILMVVGAISTIAAVVKAAEKTYELDNILDNHNEQKERFKSARDDEKLPDYTEVEYRNDITKLTFHTGIEFVKHYWSTAALLGFGLTCFGGAYKIVSRRNVVLTGMLNASNQAFTSYRANVIEKFGEDIDRKLRYNLEDVEVVHTEQDPKTGKNKKVKEKVEVLKDGVSLPNTPSAFFFDDSFWSYTGDPERDLFTLRSAQKELYRQGVIKTFCSVADLKVLLKPVSKEVIKDSDHIWGWPFDADHPDTYIDLGIYNIHSRGARDFVNGLEPVILLDPNCTLQLPVEYMNIIDKYKGVKDL